MIPILIWYIAIGVVIALFLENEKEGWATTICSLGIALLLWTNLEVVTDFLTSNPLMTFGFIAAYVVVGIIWSFIKWQVFVKAVFLKFKNIKNEFGEVTDENKMNFLNIVNNTFGYRFDMHDSFNKIAKKIAPEASKKKTLVTAWIAYWPVSLIGTLLNNPFRRFFEYVYENISGFYDKITNKYQKDAFGDLID